ncbi:MAG: hypothetical protein BGO70_14305 [Bacteroidetes bacterium 43-93]|nr:hypothetical protein [Bacteroidota bacterium]OJW99597.1 MAG: hypothetical protein BGO70_14305 [Bacteroidetes bacterium 43-93]
MQLNSQGFSAIRKYLEQKADDIRDHEGRNWAVMGVPIQNYREIIIGDRTFYIAGTNIFWGILEDVLHKANATFPLNFGSGNAVSVLHAVIRTRPIFGYTKTKDLIRRLSNEVHAYVVELKDGVVIDKILRIDWFRKLDKTRRNGKKYDFTGGLFHLLKHFEIDGYNLSTGTNGAKVQNLMSVIQYLTQALFIEDGELETDAKTLIRYISVDDKRRLKFVFYFNTTTLIYSVTTVFRSDFKKKI